MGFKIKQEKEYSFRLEFHDVGARKTLESMLKVMAPSKGVAYKRAVKIATRAVHNDPEFKNCVGPIEIRFYTKEDGLLS